MANDKVKQGKKKRIGKNGNSGFTFVILLSLFFLFLLFFIIFKFSTCRGSTGERKDEERSGGEKNSKNFECFRFGYIVSPGQLELIPFEHKRIRIRI